MESRPATLGEIADSGNELWGNCLACSRGAVLDLEALIERFGRNFPVMGVNGRLRCTVCGSRETAANRQPVTW